MPNKSGEPIEITDPRDLALLAVAEGAAVTGAILPSGYHVPDGLAWVVRGNKLVLEHYKRGEDKRPPS